MLKFAAMESLEDVVSWMPHGRAFKIHDPKVFASTIMPKFFNQSKYTSFQRQLNLYGENTAVSGGRKNLCFRTLCAVMPILFKRNFLIQSYA
ncbi:hypothetical protein ACHAXS_006561 [Conticribra weissflogii]